MQRTAHIFPNALVSTPHPNVAVMRKCQVLPVEVVVRGFMTGMLCFEYVLTDCVSAISHALAFGLTHHHKICTLALLQIAELAMQVDATLSIFHLPPFHFTSETDITCDVRSQH